MIDPSTSLGAAIGLQGTPKDYGQQFVNQLNREQAAVAKRAADEQKAKDKEAERFSKLMAVKPGKYLPGRTEAIKQKTAEMVSYASKLREEGKDPMNDETFWGKYNDYANYVKNAEAEYNSVQKDASMSATMRNGKPMYKWSDEAGIYVSQDPNALSAETAFYVPGAGVSQLYDKYTLINEAAPKIGSTLVVTTTPNGQVYDIKKTKEVNRQKNLDWANDFWRTATSNIDTADSPIAKSYYKGILEMVDTDPTTRLKTDEEKSVIIKNLFLDSVVNDLESRQDAEYQNMIKQKSKGVNVTVNTGAEEAKNTEYPINSISAKTMLIRNPEGKSVDAPGAKNILEVSDEETVITPKISTAFVAFKSGDFRPPASNQMFYMDDYSRPKAGDPMNITGGHVSVIKVFKKGAKIDGVDVSGLPVTDDYVDRYNQPGISRSDKEKFSNIVEEKGMFFGVNLMGEKESPIVMPLDISFDNIQRLKESGKTDKEIVEISLKQTKKTSPKPMGTPTVKKSKYVKGYVEGGYEFQGGDPADQKNWKKIK